MGNIQLYRTINMIEILTIWLKIIGIIILWEAWKYIAWAFINWWVERQVRKQVREHEKSKSKCPYLNGEMDE